MSRENQEKSGNIPDKYVTIFSMENMKLKNFEKGAWLRAPPGPEATARGHCRGQIQWKNHKKIIGKWG